MKLKVLIVAFLVVICASGGYLLYQHYFVKTLMLSEVVGKTDDPTLSLVIKFADFDTGLTRYDLHRLRSNKDYWIKRVNEVDAISDPDLKEQEAIKLLDEMMEDPALRKICQGVLNLGSKTAFSIIQFIL